MLSLLSSSKNFNDTWIGSRILNQLGVHIYRIRLAKLASNMRSKLSGYDSSQWTESLDKNGYVVIPEFLPQADFESLYVQLKQQTMESLRDFPLKPSQTKGFGAKQEFSGGFDRYDGSTLNRFLEIKNSNDASIRLFTQDPRLDSLCRKVSGFRLDANRLLVYLTVHGDMKDNPDRQKVLHRDTFHSSLKFWYFLEDVKDEDGPFVYVPESHKMNGKRLEWERHQALVSCGALDDSNSLNHGGGAFRVHESDLKEMGYPEPQSLPVSANTLVLADTNGFHRRGDSISGSQRLALYGWRRPWPFLLKGW